MQDGSSASSPATPPNQGAPAHFTSELSPPDSQQLHAQNPANAPSPFTPLGGTAAATSSKAAAANTSKKMPPSASLNANGKRGWDNNGVLKAGADKGSGYKWEKEEDAPGWAWQNPKAREEYTRAWGQVVEKDRKIGTKYGDLLLK